MIIKRYLLTYLLTYLLVVTYSFCLRLRYVTLFCAGVRMERQLEELDKLEVVPVIDDKPLSQSEMVGDALSIISLKQLSDDSDPDRVVKRNSFRNLHRPDISHLDWVSQASISNKEEVQGGAKNGASLSHCKHPENSTTKLRGNW